MIKLFWFSISILSLAIAIFAFAYFWSYDRFCVGDWVLIHNDTYCIVKHQQDETLILEDYYKTKYISINLKKFSIKQRLHSPFLTFEQAAQIELDNIWFRKRDSNW